MDIRTIESHDALSIGNATSDVSGWLTMIPVPEKAISSLIVAIGTVDSIGMTGIPSHFGLIQGQLRETSARHTVASQNIANINTPGYQAKEVGGFSESLKDAESSGQGVVIRDKAGLNSRLDGNNVDIHDEIGALKKNTLAHNVYTQILASKIRQMRSAMSDR